MNDTFHIPVVTHFYGVASISFTVRFDTAIFAYQDTTDINIELSNGTLNINQNGNKIITSWYTSGVTLNIANALLFRLHFVAKTLGASSLQWFSLSRPEDNQIGNNTGAVLPAVFINGLISRNNCATLNGTVTYANTALTPMTSTQVKLYDQTNTLVNQVNTTAAGVYQFSNLAYDLFSLKSSTSKPAGGYNSK